MRSGYSYQLARKYQIPHDSWLELFFIIDVVWNRYQRWAFYNTISQNSNNSLQFHQPPMNLVRYLITKNITAASRFHQKLTTLPWQFKKQRWKIFKQNLLKNFLFYQWLLPTIFPVPRSKIDPMTRWDLSENLVIKKKKSRDES